MTAIRALFWDIDGTVLTTKRAGVVAWERAAHDVAGTTVALATLDSAGLTDVEVAALVLEACKVAPTSDALAAVISSYEDHLPSCLPLRDGHAFHEARMILDGLRGRTDTVSVLLTGNTPRGASAKLSRFGLDAYFAGGGFASLATPSRASIAMAAHDFVRRRLGERVSTDRLYVIGDTPHDVACAGFIGARAVAVASGDYSVEALARARPWRVLPRLPGPHEFLEMLSSGPAT